MRVLEFIVFDANLSMGNVPSGSPWRYTRFNPWSLRQLLDAALLDAPREPRFRSRRMAASGFSPMNTPCRQDPSF